MWDLIASCTTAMIALRSIPLVSVIVTPKWRWYKGFAWLLDSIAVDPIPVSISAEKQANGKQQTFRLGLVTLHHSFILFLSESLE